MKQDWTQDELIEHWTLAPGELVLLMNKSGAGRLGFAALLKFFQAEGRFPGGRSEIPAAAVDYLVRQPRLSLRTGPITTGTGARSNTIALKSGRCWAFVRRPQRIATR